MIYTVGHSESYRERIASEAARGTRLEKMGRLLTREDDPEKWDDRPDLRGYAGGVVFRTREQAARYLVGNDRPAWSVFGLDTGWENTYQHPDEPHRSLIASAEIVLLDEGA